MSTIDFDLHDRVVIVAGAGGGGIGTAVMRRVAQAGATVIAVNRTLEHMVEYADELIAEGRQVYPVTADVSTEPGIAKVMQRAADARGELYGLVNVAGGAAPETWMPAIRVSRQDWRDLFTANLETMFFMSQAVAAELRGSSRPGSIVSVSSISGMNTAPFHIGYGAAKAAIVAVTRTLALELASDGVRVNAVAPGVTATAASGAYVDVDEVRDRQAIAMGRRGTPEEQADAIVFLLSGLSSYVTGQTLLVDGGLDLRWTHVGADNTSVFLKDESFRAAITH
ncbi:SDR family NAD(P)-dependent oxidoreductase [Gordonia sp. NPDC127522]|uniref:SDR family NAD(P)-dependent oxidoreductase n=1 Tax=Gordonia sp. NPDC127522 TaxID=3345390 RepID=UPI00363BF5FA